MQEQKFERLQNSAAEEFERRSMSAAMKDAIRKLEAKAIVDETVQAMKDRGEAFELTDEEEKMLLAFRRFKLRMRKDGEVFTWQSRKPEGVQVVSETAEIVHPNEGV